MISPEEQIAAVLRAVGAPPKAQLDPFIASGRRGRLEKGEPFIRLGDSDHRLAFLHTGIVRYHVITEDTGEDITKDFSFAPSFTVSFGSAVTREPARVAITAVEDCVVTVWPWPTFVALFDQDAAWERIGRRFAEILYVRKENREVALLSQDAGARYEAALRAFPPEIARVPQHLLASYLGVAPESLSRLKRRKSQRK